MKNKHEHLTLSVYLRYNKTVPDNDHWQRVQYTIMSTAVDLTKHHNSVKANALLKAVTRKIGETLKSRVYAITVERNDVNTYTYTAIIPRRVDVVGNNAIYTDSVVTAEIEL